MEPPDPDRVASLRDLAEFLEALSQHFDERHQTDEWQHWYVGSYLDSMAAWLRGTPAIAEAREERQRELEREAPTWRGVALMFDAARVYE